jgi:hypothetical protein
VYSLGLNNRPRTVALQGNPAHTILHRKFPCLKPHIFLMHDLQSVKNRRGGLFRLRLYSIHQWSQLIHFCRDTIPLSLHPFWLDYTVCMSWICAMRMFHMSLGWLSCGVYGSLICPNPIPYMLPHTNPSPPLTLTLPIHIHMWVPAWYMSQRSQSVF